MNQSSNSPIIVLVGRLLVPFIQIFALYVIFHGHYSPGGGFQGGAMLAASVLLMRLALGNQVGQFQFRRSWDTVLGAFGVFIFAGIGIIAMVFGGKYLDYATLTFLGEAEATRRSLGILLIEVGVGFGVMAALVSIYDDLTEDGTNA